MPLLPRSRPRRSQSGNLNPPSTKNRGMIRSHGGFACRCGSGFLPRISPPTESRNDPLPQWTRMPLWERFRIAILRPRQNRGRIRSHRRIHCHRWCGCGRVSYRDFSPESSPYSIQSRKDPLPQKNTLSSLVWLWERILPRFQSARGLKFGALCPSSTRFGNDGRHRTARCTPSRFCRATTRESHRPYRHRLGQSVRWPDRSSCNRRRI